MTENQTENNLFDMQTRVRATYEYITLWNSPLNAHRFIHFEESMLIAIFIYGGTKNAESLISKMCLALNNRLDNPLSDEEQAVAKQHLTKHFGASL